MTTKQKIAFLKSRGWIVGKRDPRLNTDFPGSQMCCEPFEDHEVPTRDGRNGPWCVVGDDLPSLVNQAFDFAYGFAYE